MSSSSSLVEQQIVKSQTSSMPTITRKKFQVLRRDTAAADLTFGSFAGIFGRLIEHPWDTVKVRLQTSDSFKGPVDCFVKTYKNEGFKGFYKGLSTPLVGSLLENAIIFTAYNMFQSLIRRFSNMKKDEDLTIRQLCLAGFLSGGVISFVLTPVELVKCNLQVQDVQNLYNSKGSGGNVAAAAAPKFKGPFCVIRDTIKQHGLRGMYHGHMGTFLRESFGGVAWFGSYEFVCNMLAKHQQKTSDSPVTKKNLKPQYLMAAGAVAGMTFNGAFFPADVVKSRVQTQGLNGTNMGFFEAARDLYRTGGIKPFFRGFGMTVGRAAPTSACIFMTYEMMSRTFAYD